MYARILYNVVIIVFAFATTIFEKCKWTSLHRSAKICREITAAASHSYNMILLLLLNILCCRLFCRFRCCYSISICYWVNSIKPQSQRHQFLPLSLSLMPIHSNRPADPHWCTRPSAASLALSIVANSCCWLHWVALHLHLYIHIALQLMAVKAFVNIEL